MKLTLHTLQGEELFECNVDVSSSQDWSLMADNKLSITFQLEHCVNLSPGSYVDYDGVRFYLLKEFKPTEIDSATWSYNLTLFDAASWMSVTVPVNLLDGKNNPTFVYTASLREHAAIIVANLNRRMNTNQWKVGNIIDSSNITVKYDGRYCSAILQELVDDQNTEWWVDGMTLNIGRAEFGEAVELGYGNGLLGNIVCAQADNMRSYAYLYPLGSTRNIDPTKYGYERLQLPNGQMYVDMSETGIAELVEERAFAGIFPRYEGTVTSVRSRAATSDNGGEFIIYYISDSDIPFNPNNYKMPGLVPNITFLSGELMGQDFEVNYDADAHEFEIITRWTSDNATQLPGGLLTPAVGDEYVVWNITMPDEYYPMAEREFLEAAQKFADNSEKDISIYKASLDYIEVQERGLQLRPGQKVRLISSEYFPDKGYYDSRITRITRKLWHPDEVAIDVSAVRVIGSLSRIESSLSKTESRVSQLSVSIPAIIKSTDNSLPTDSSVYTSLRVDKEYLSRRKGGVMDGPLFIENTLSSASWTGSKGFAFSKLPDGASYRGDIDEFHAKELFAETFYIAGIPFRKMANGSLFIDANVVFGGGATMYGTDTTPAPSIFDGLPIDNETIYWDGNVLKAMGGGGGGGVADSVAWANVYGKPTWITNTKPTYNYSEIQGTPDLSQYVRSRGIVKADSLRGNWLGYTYTDEGYGGKYAGGVISAGLESYGFQLNANNSGTRIALRSNNNSTWTAWKTIAMLDDIPSLTGYATQSWVEEQQYLTEITSGMIESVLGYQPYDGDTNRLGFLTASALNGYATESWVNTALAGYLPLSGGTINGSLSIASGLTVRHSAASIVVRRTQNLAALIKYENSNGVLGQLGLNTNETILFIDASGHYRTLLDSGNYTNYALSKNGGTVNGALNMNASFQLGNNKPITVADADGVYQTALYLSSANNFIIGYGTSVVGKRKTVLLGNRIEFRSAGNENNTLVLNSDHSSEFSGKVTAPSFIGNLTGDTANIGTLQIITNEVNGANGTGNAHINYSSTGKVTIANGGGNVAIGGTTASEKLHVHGNLLTEGGITMYSQRSLKNILSYEGLSLEQLAVIKPIKFTWKDGRDNRYHVGGVADDVEAVVPEVVYSANDFLTMDYGNAGFYVAASLIKPVIHCYNKVEKHEHDIDYLKRENVAIKKENKALRDEINQLKQAS